MFFVNKDDKINKKDVLTFKYFNQSIIFSFLYFQELYNICLRVDIHI